MSDGETDPEDNCKGGTKSSRFRRKKAGGKVQSSERTVITQDIEHRDADCAKL